MTRFFKSVFFILALLTASVAQAEKVEVDAVTRVVESIKSEDTLNYSDVAKQISMLEESLKNGQHNTDMLSNSVKVLGEFRNKLAQSRKQAEKELQFVQKRIDAWICLTD